MAPLLAAAIVLAMIAPDLARATNVAQTLTHYTDNTCTTASGWSGEQTYQVQSDGSMCYTSVERNTVGGSPNTRYLKLDFTCVGDSTFYQLSECSSFCTGCSTAAGVASYTDAAFQDFLKGDTCHILSWTNPGSTTTQTIWQKTSYDIRSTLSYSCAGYTVDGSVGLTGISTSDWNTAAQTNLATTLASNAGSVCGLNGNGACGVSDVIITASSSRRSMTSNYKVATYTSAAAQSASTAMSTYTQSSQFKTDLQATGGAYASLTGATATTPTVQSDSAGNSAHSVGAFSFGVVSCILAVIGALL